jgi:hypothetical protein
VHGQPLGERRGERVRPGHPRGAGQLGPIDPDPECGGPGLGRCAGEQVGQPVGERGGGERDR